MYISFYKLKNVRFARFFHCEEEQKGYTSPPHRFRNDATLPYVDTEQGLLRYTPIRRPRVHTTNLSSRNRFNNYIYSNMLQSFPFPVPQEWKKVAQAGLLTFSRFCDLPVALMWHTVIKKNAKPFYWNYSWGYSSGLAPDSLFNPSSMNAWWITCDGDKGNQYFPIEQE